MFYAIIKKASFIGLGLFLALGFLGNSTAQADWKAEWEKTVEAAKKEGHLTTYISGYERVLEPFKKKYPEIKVVSISGRTGQMANRLLAERRAGKYIGDIYSGGANTQYTVLYKGRVLDSIKSLFIFPEILDESKWLNGKHSFADPEGEHIFAYQASPAGGTFMYNSNLLNPKEITSYWDLLNPKWKGKIVSVEPTHFSLGSAIIFFHENPKLGPKFIRQFFGQRVDTFSRNRRQMTDWLAKGKFALCVGCGARSVLIQGLPVGYMLRWKEGQYITPGIGALSFINRAPHPNAAKVFVNWFFSREGQIAFQKIGRPGEHPNSSRIDIPKDIVSPESKLIEGAKYFDTNRADLHELRLKTIVPFAKEVTKEARKRMRK